MPEGRKIATCCYCGTRSVLELDSARHALHCAACGAPITRMKAMRADSAATGPARRRAPSKPSGYPGHAAPDRPRKRKGRKKRRGMLYYLKEAFDEIEDLFD